MSIYSGLPTRQDERNYNSLLVKLIQALQEHVIDVTHGAIEPRFANKYKKIIGKMETYEEHKYLPPKYTTLLQPLIGAIYNSRNLLLEGLQTIREKKQNFLQSVKEEEEIPSARQMINRKSGAPSSYKKNKSEAGIESCHKLKKNELHDTNKSKKIGNRRSCSVFTEKNTKIGEVKENLQSMKDHSIKNEDQCNVMNYSEEYFKRRKHLRSKMHYLQKNRKNKPLFPGQIENSFEKISNATQSRRRIMTEESKHTNHSSALSQNLKHFYD